MPEQKYGTLRPWDYIKITLFGFALTGLYQGLHSVIIPLRLLDFVPETQKNTYLSLLTLSGLLIAMLLQPVAGSLSDRTVSRWGRRRPYILIGGLAAAVIIPCFGLVAGYAAMFIIYCCLQAATNVAQGPYQGFIPDIVPEKNRGTASGVKGILEVTGGMLLVYLTSLWMDHYHAGEGSGYLWLVLGVLAVLMFAVTTVTVLLVREPPRITREWGASVRATLLGIFSREIWRNRNFLWFLVSRLLMYMAFTTIQQFALYYMQDVIGVTNPGETTAQFTIVAVIGMVIVVWPAGFLSDRLGRRWINMSAGLLGAIAIVIIGTTSSYSTILFAGGIIGIAMGIFNSANWALATDFATRDDGARFLGIANMATAGGAVLARVIGPAIDFFNLQSPNRGYQFMLLVCLVYFVVGALLVTRVRPRRISGVGTG